MTLEQIIKQNYPRIFALATLTAALYFDAQSIASHETLDIDRNYNVANIIAPFAGIFNVAGRIVDQYPLPNKRQNILAGSLAIMIMLSEASLSTSTVFSDFKLPPSVPVVMGTCSLSLLVRLNWITSLENKPLRENAGRILALVSAIFTVLFSILSIIHDSKRSFLIAGTLQSLSVFFESANRAAEIVRSENTIFLNKSSAVVYLFAIFSAVIVNILGAARLLKESIALFPTLMHGASMLYMLTQFTFQNEQARSPLTERSGLFSSPLSPSRVVQFSYTQLSGISAPDITVL